MAAARDVINDAVSDVMTRAGLSSSRQSTAKRAVWHWLQARLSGRGRGLVRGRVVTYAPTGRPELQELDVPLAGRGQVTVVADRSAVSPGTERAQYLGLAKSRADVGFTPGFVLAGRVSVAPDGSRFDVGDEVVVLGASHQSVITVDEGQVVPAPVPGAPELSSLLHVAVISLHGVDRAGDVTGRDVVVLGAGLIGGLAAAFAAHAGAASVTVVAASDAKREAYTAITGVRFLTTDELDVPATGVPVVIEATGHADAIADAVGIVADGGTVVLLGSTRATAASVPMAALHTAGASLVGAHVSALAPGSAAHADTIGRAAAALADTRPTRLAPEWLDPREPDVLYRRLADDRALVGIGFDWTLLDEQARSARVSLATPPQDRGLGVDARSRPVPADSPDGNGAVAGTAVTDPAAPATGSPSTSSVVAPLRLALAGCGEIAMETSAAAAVTDAVTVAAAFDVVPELADDVVAQHPGAVRLPSYEAVLASDVDAIVLSVPHHLHEPMFTAALEAGKHVVVEKPMANDIAGARRMVASATAADGVGAIAFPQRYDPDVTAARRVIDAGGLGQLRGGHLVWIVDKPPSYLAGGYTGRVASSWRARRDTAGGGILIMNLCHHLDLLRYLTGEEVTSVVARTVPGGDELEEGLGAVLTTSSGAVFTVSATAAARGAGPQVLRLWGDDGQLVVERGVRAISSRHVDGRQAGRWHEISLPPASPSRAQFLTAFAAHVRGEGPPPTTVEDGFRNQAIIDAAYRSQHTGAAEVPAPFEGAAT